MFTELQQTGNISGTFHIVVQPSESPHWAEKAQKANDKQVENWSETKLTPSHPPPTHAHTTITTR